MSRTSRSPAAWSLLALLGCAPGEVTAVPDDASADHVSQLTDRGASEVTPRFDAPLAEPAPDRPTPPDASDASVAPGDRPTPRDLPPPPDVVALGDDDAEIAEVIFPTTLSCGARTEGTIRVRNRGGTTWTLAGGYALGALDDSDPFYTRGSRVRLGDADAVAPGQTHTFSLPLQALTSSGDHTSDWRMVREGVRWFGDAATQRVAVRCTPPPTAPFRLSDVQIIASPDVRGFAVTSRLTEVGFRPGTFRIDHTRRGMWPPVTISDDGTLQEATVWIFFHIDGAWYGTGGERLRPNQSEKMLERASIIGTDWFYDRNRWGVMAGYVPAPGELVGFMVVAGYTRVDDRTPVRETTNVVLIRFPEDGVAASYPPFAWEE